MTCVKEDVHIFFQDLVLLDSFTLQVEGEGLKSKLFHSTQSSVPNCHLQRKGVFSEPRATLF